MQPNTLFILCTFVIWATAHARSINAIESEMSKKESDQPSKEYTELMDYLKLLRTNINENNDDDSNDLSSNSVEDIKPTVKRDFFLFPTRRSNQRHRPATYTYGRKSHWDTFFG